MEHDSGCDFMLAYAVMEIYGWQLSDVGIDPLDLNFSVQKLRDMVLERMKHDTPNKSLQPTPGGASVDNSHLSSRVAEL
jgi:hypothetical protein